MKAITTQPEKNISFNFNSMILKPIFHGFLGFTLFIISLTATKYISSLFGNIEITLDKSDFMVAGLGFFLIAAIKLLSNFKDKY